MATYIVSVDIDLGAIEIVSQPIGQLGYVGFTNSRVCPILD